MNLSKDQIVERLRRVKGPDMEGNIVDLGLVSEILLKDGRVSFSITVPAERASELEPLRQAAEKVVREIDGVTGVVAVLTAEKRPGAAGGGNGRRRRAARRCRRAPGCGRRGPAAWAVGRRLLHSLPRPAPGAAMSPTSPASST